MKRYTCQLWLVLDDESVARLPLGRLVIHGDFCRCFDGGIRWALLGVTWQHLSIWLRFIRQGTESVLENVSRHDLLFYAGQVN